MIINLNSYNIKFWSPIFPSLLAVTIATTLAFALTSLPIIAVVFNHNWQEKSNLVSLEVNMEMPHVFHSDFWTVFENWNLPWDGMTCHRQQYSYSKQWELMNVDSRLFNWKNPSARNRSWILSPGPITNQVIKTEDILGIILSQRVQSISNQHKN